MAISQLFNDLKLSHLKVAAFLFNEGRLESFLYSVLEEEFEQLH